MKKEIDHDGTAAGEEEPTKVEKIVAPRESESTDGAAGEGASHDGEGRVSIDEVERLAREEMEVMLKNRHTAEDAERERIRLESERATEHLAIEDEAPDPDKLTRAKRKSLWPVVAVAVVVIAVFFGAVFFVAGGLFRKQKVDVAVADPRRSQRERQEERRRADAAALKLVENARQAADQAKSPANSAPSPHESERNGGAAAQGAGNLAPYTHPATGVNAAGTVPPSAGDPAASGRDPDAGAHRSNNKSSQHTAGARTDAGREQIARLPSSSASSQEPFLYLPASGDGATRGAPVSRRREPSPGGTGMSEAAMPSAAESPAVVPPFGTLLPVRTLGALYTLRSQNMTRMELTRDVEGRGWRLRRGTVIVGQLQGSDADRAFVRIAGYIDPRENKLVSFGGVVKGIDGGEGLKGKRRVVGSAWTRALTRAGERAINLAQSWLAGRGGGTTIITGASQPAVAELDGVELRERRREFVEVEAGTNGYVMITDLPPAVEGQAPAAGEAPAQGTTLSQEEIAHLLTEGSPAEIRAALPRMTPPLRAVAEEVLKAAR